MGTSSDRVVMENSATRLQSSIHRAAVQRRAFKRPAPTRHAMLQAHGAVQCPSIRSITRSGIKLDGAFGLQPGDAVTVRLPTQQIAGGTVEWSVAGFCGIRFSQPLGENDPALADA